MINEKLFWIAVSKPSIKAETVNKFLIHLNNNHLEVNDFINSDRNSNLDNYPGINEIFNNRNSMGELVRVEDELKEHSIDIVPITSAYYSKCLKENLKINSPPVIFTKGNKELLNEKSTAVVGSRSASDVSLKFTDDIVGKNVKRNKVIVSGYAIGVDRQALDSALKHDGKSIIVLPQGILTFKSGFRQFENEINSGRLLIISTYFPKSKWSVPFAMARNSIIYGLAEEIYVAESNFSGGTWSGVQKGLRKNRIIFVRNPLAEEKNANKRLIELGARPYNWQQEILYEASLTSDENVSDENNTDFKTPVDLILDCLSSTPQTAKTIKDILKLNWNTGKITSILKNSDKAETLKTKPLKFVRKNLHQLELF